MSESLVPTGTVAVVSTRHGQYNWEIGNEAAIFVKREDRETVVEVRSPDLVHEPTRNAIFELASHYYSLDEIPTLWDFIYQHSPEAEVLEMFGIKPEDLKLWQVAHCDTVYMSMLTPIRVAEKEEETK